MMARQGMLVLVLFCFCVFGVRGEDPTDCSPELAPKIRKSYFEEETYFAVKHLLTPEQFEEWWRRGGEEGEGEGEGRAPRSVVYGFYEEGDGECLGALKKDIAFQCAQLHTGPSFIDVLLVPTNILPSSMLPDSSSCGLGFIGGGCLFSDTSCVTFSPFDEKNDDDIVRHTMGWTAGLGTAKLVVKNRRSEPIYLFWLQEGSEERPSGMLPPGDETTFSTSLSHAFYARDGESVSSKVVGAVVCLNPRGQEWIVTEDAPTDEDFTEFHDIIFRNWIGAREARNFLQSRVIHPVTKEGFKKIRLPEVLYKEILGYYNTQQKYEELETSVGPCLNQEIADTWMVHLPGYLKDKISVQLLPILEEWSNEKLEKTALYGIRKYTRNSVLEMHTDTAHTHAVSAIINMKQEGMESDWPLEIYDHHNVLHEVVMQPGDMVLYESAKLLHGRTQPLNGEGYANFFLHYRPTDLSRWDYLWM